nr:hypothetical protein JVH1_7780 [Rhodococcus sp. JVH1]
MVLRYTRSGVSPFHSFSDPELFSFSGRERAPDALEFECQ